MTRATWVAIGAFGVMVGCKGQTDKTQVPAADTSSAMGKVDSTAVERAETRHRRARATDSAAGAIAARTQTIPAGTVLALTSNAKVCTNTNHPGDTFTAAPTNPIPTSSGGSLPSSATVVLGVTQVKPSNNVTQHGKLGVAVDSLTVNGTSYPLDADITSVKTTQVRATSMGQEATKTGIGAAAGAIIGGIIGHSAKTAIIGAAAGGVAGGGVAYATTKYDFCIPQGGAITAKLTSDLPVRTQAM
jgi:hypothetical protein